MNKHVSNVLLFLGVTAAMVVPALVWTPPPQSQYVVQAPVAKKPDKIWIVIVEIDNLQQALERRFKTEDDCNQYMRSVVLPRLDFWTMDYAKCEWRTEDVLNF